MELGAINRLYRLFQELARKLATADCFTSAVSAVKRCLMLMHVILRAYPFVLFGQIDVMVH
jgi:hypothetical protein